ncbi:MAG: sugar ABC transporter permease, partial [Actinomycetota bacterium]|nr:sugar ABC transporter permease [Actinomycetota bacterium]
RTLSITLVYTAASVLGAVGIGLLAALGMNRMTGRFRLLRGLVIIPWAVPIIPVALVSTWMLDNQYGVVNWVLTRTGVIEGNVAWLSDENTALPAILAITVWRIFPFSAVVLLAALQSVPGELYEAARVDGTSRLNQFRHVTLPMIRPVLAILVLFVTIWSLRRFDLIWVLTEGGPLGSTTTLVVALYQAAFRESELGLGSAIGVVGFVVAMVVTAGYFVLQARAGKTSGRRDAH